MKFPFRASVAAVALVFSTYCGAAGLTTDTQKFSYAIGVNLGNVLKSQGIVDVDPQAFTSAMTDVLEGRALQLNIAEMKQAIENQQKSLNAAAEQKARLKQQQGVDFLEKNKSAEGVVVLDNGLQYIVLKPGDGKQPAATDTVTVDYHGTLTDGTVFDSSVVRGSPASFALNQVIPGFKEAITRMKTGGKWRVFVPSELAYGERGTGGKIGPNETLIFEIELLEIK